MADLFTLPLAVAGGVANSVAQGVGRIVNAAVSGAAEVAQQAVGMTASIGEKLAAGLPAAPVGGRMGGHGGGHTIMPSLSGSWQRGHGRHASLQDAGVNDKVFPWDLPASHPSAAATVSGLPDTVKQNPFLYGEGHHEATAAKAPQPTWGGSSVGQAENTPLYFGGAMAGGSRAFHTAAAARHSAGTESAGAGRTAGPGHMGDNVLPNAPGGGGALRNNPASNAAEHLAGTQMTATSMPGDQAPTAGSTKGLGQGLGARDEHGFRHITSLGQFPTPHREPLRPSMVPEEGGDVLRHEVAGGGHDLASTTSGIAGGGGAGAFRPTMATRQVIAGTNDREHGIAPPGTVGNLDDLDATEHMFDPVEGFSAPSQVVAKSVTGHAPYGKSLVPGSDAGAFTRTLSAPGQDQSLAAAANVLGRDDEFATAEGGPLPSVTPSKPPSAALGSGEDGDSFNSVLSAPVAKDPAAKAARAASSNEVLMHSGGPPSAAAPSTEELQAEDALATRAKAGTALHKDEGE